MQRPDDLKTKVRGEKPVSSAQYSIRHCLKMSEEML